MVWVLDSSKQCVGAGVAHIANLIIAIFLARLGGSDEVGGREKGREGGRKGTRGKDKCMKLMYGV